MDMFKFYIKNGAWFMKLPSEFIQKMVGLLGQSEYDDFIGSFKKPRFYGLRVNTLKIGVEEFKRLSPFKLKPVPWNGDGFYYEESESPG
jgi:16S rRNA C967 or C1407 C5-methylase (RsmB/RsmF family)